MKKIFYSFMALLVAAITFTSCEDVPMPYDAPGTGGGSSSQTTIEPAGTGTADDPYNVAAAIEKCKETGETETTEVYYVKGVVKSIDDSGIAQYGNITIDMIDEGGSNVFKAFQIYSFNSKKFTNETAAAIKEGDIVIIKGHLVNYKGNTPETTGKGAACLVSVNSEGSDDGGETIAEAKGTGTEADPFNVAAAIAKCKETGETATTEQYYVKGKVKNTDVSGVAQYGNINIDIVDEGTTAVFKAFQIYSFNGKKFTAESAAAIKEGDEVVIKGNLVNYKGNTPETTGKGAACLVSLNGKKEEQGGDPTPSTGEAKGDGTLENPFNSVAANAYASTLEAGTESDKDIYIKGKVVSVKEQFGTQYGNATFYISDDGTSADQFYVFRCYYLNNEKYTSGDLLQVGDEVIVCGKVTNYMGNTPETAQGKAYLYSLKSNGGGNQGGDNQGGEISGNSITIKCADLGLANGTDAGTQTLADGTVLTFDGGGNSNTPKYYNAGSNIRMYPKNSVNVKAKKKISSIVMNCDTYNGTICNASGDVSANPGSVNVNGNVITVTVGANETTITNTSTQTGAASQIRFVSLTINYAE